jgi:uncharacterized membrane protein
MYSVAAHVLHPRLHVAIRRVPALRPLAWLRLGTRDMKASLAPSLAHGLGGVMLGWLMLATLGTDPYFVAIAVMGFLLVGPALAAGACGLSRFIDLGRQPTFDDSLEPLRKAGGTVLRFGALLVLVALGWFLLSEAVLRSVFDVHGGNLADSLYRGFFEQGSAPVMAAYAVIGTTLCLIVFALSVVSVPLMIHRYAGVRDAMAVSLEVVRRNPAAMLVWAALIVTLTVVGFATMLAGMVVILPLLGHATWRAYRDLIES